MLATPETGVGVSCPGSEPEYFRHPLGQVIFGHRGVDPDDRQLETLRFLAEESGEHPVTLEQVTQGPLRIAGLIGDLPQRAPAGERGPAELGVGRSQTA